MRPGRKSASSGASVTPKPLPVRSCAVRVVRKTESATLGSTTTAVQKSNSISQSSWRNTSTPVNEERKFRGPLKKRPITEVTAPSPVKNSASKRDSSYKSTPKTPATPLVAGRTRRNIKPNPKYTGEDIVTPRILKNVTSGGKDDDDTDDFFYHESSDDDDDDDDDAFLDDLIGKAFNESDKDITNEYDTPKIVNSKPNQSNSSTSTPVTAPRKRGRPRREPIASPVDSNTSAVSGKTVTTTTAKNELLAKAMGVRQPNAEKRLAEREPDDLHVTRKRFIISTEGQKLKTLNEYENKATTRSSSSTATPTSVKPITRPINKTTSYRLKEILDEALGSDMEEMNDDVAAAPQKTETPMKAKDANVQQENIALDGERKKLPDCKVVIKKTLPVLRTRMQVEQHGKNNSIATADIKNNDTLESPAVKQVTDKEMPTFTIVNINDIISKKGDALISKSSTVSQDAVNNNKIQTSTTTNGREMNSLQQKRLIRKDTTGKGPTILNHQLANRQLTVKTATTTSNATKQAPRILNAIVSKKTQPVKPTTQNPYDSAESFTLSLDEDEETDNDVNKTFCSIGTDLSLTESEYNTEDEKSSRSSYRQAGRKRNLPLRAEAAKRALKLNRSSADDQTNVPPETVEITRQGNKIVKKITCLENWYVITRVNEVQSQAAAARNILKMPLIELANAAKTLELPNDKWSSKVTLYELPAATLAKGKFTTYTGDIAEYDISEDDRKKYQPSCVMFRRTAETKEKSRMPYDRAVILKNNTFYTNVDGKNVRLIAAPNIVETQEHVEIMLNIMDTISLQSELVEATGSI